jgi:hypothetical protein
MPARHLIEADQPFRVDLGFWVRFLPSECPASFPCRDEGSEHGIDAGLIAGSVRLEPVQHVGVEAEIRAELRACDAWHNGLLPTGQSETVKSPATASAHGLNTFAVASNY